MTRTEEITQTVLARIRTGLYRGREMIPCERSLAAEFCVNIKTLNRALTTLVERGHLFRQRGKGTFVAPRTHWRNLTISLGFFKNTDPGTDPVFTRFFAGAHTAGKSAGCRVDLTTLLSAHAANPGQVDKRLDGDMFREAVLADDPDGLILLGDIDTALIEELARDRVLIVAGEIPPTLAVDHVRRDVRQAVVDMVRMFWQQGHRHIELATYQYPGVEHDLVAKAAGYTAAVREFELAPQIFSLPWGASDDQIKAWSRSLPKPTAVIVTESTLARRIVQLAPAQGFSIPKDLAVVSFDDGDMGELIQPSMSSLHAFGADLGALAVEKLLDRLAGKATERIAACLPCEFIERESSRWGREPSA